MPPKIVLCKACKKEVSELAKACPHCGDDHPGIDLSKGCGIGCLIIFVLFAVAMIWSTISDLSNKPAATEHTVKEFNFTTEEMITRYNQSMKTIDQKIRVSMKNELKNENQLTIQLNSSSKAIAMVLTANPETRLVNSILLIGGGDGTPKSGLDIIMGILALVMTVEDPYMPIGKRKTIGETFGISDGTIMDRSGHTIDRGNFRYSITISEALGIMITAVHL